MKRRLAIALIIGSLAACGSDEDPTDYLTVDADVAHLGGQISVDVEQPSRKSSYKNSQLGDGVTVQTERTGNMLVSLVLVGSANDTISSGQLQLGLQRGFIYAVHVNRRPANFTGDCFGCGGQMKFPINDSRQPTTDSLLVSYSAAPLCKGCVY